MRTSFKTVLLLWLLTLPAVVQAQFVYTTNNGALTITQYTGPGGDVTIPSMTNDLPVTSIGYNAFSDCTSLTSVTIPDSITNIGGCAFSECWSLTSLVIPDSVTNIGNSAFSGSGLTSITIPSSVISIGQQAFYGCNYLYSVTILGSVTSVGSGAFQSCTYLGSIYFKGNAPSVGSYAFSGDSYATIYYLPGTTGWTSPFGGLYTALWFLPKPLILSNGPKFGVRTNRFGFIVSWATNKSVVVEACTNLRNPTWSPVGTNSLTGGSFYFSDPQWTNYPARFYRLRLP